MKGKEKVESKRKAAALAALVSCAALVASANANKFIAGGWEFASATADDLLAKAELYDQSVLDGYILYINASTRVGYRLSSREIIHQPAWDWEDLKPLVPKYRQLLAHKAFRHSFLNSYRAATNRVAWADDAAWAKIAHNMRLAARLAAAGGFEGLQMDPEDYYNQRQYDYVRSDAPTYAEAAHLARRRAAEVFKGVFEEFPNVKILSYWLASMDSMVFSATDGRTLARLCVDRERDLWIPFLNGILDVLPPQATLVDGNEHAYTWEASRGEYTRGAVVIHQNLVHLMAEENREKYRRQMQNSFGVYLDGYSTKTNGLLYMAPVEGSRLKHLALNVAQAAAAADEYLWFWGEKGTWAKDWYKRWEDRLPGLNDALEAIKDPAALGRRLRERAAKSGTPALNANVACLGTDEKKVPEKYGSWQEPPSRRRQGVFGCDLTTGFGDSSSLVATGVERGCLQPRIFVPGRPGDIFGISFVSKGPHASASVGWVRDGKWDWTIPRMLIPVTGEPDADGWRRTDWAVMIPSGATGFGLMLDVDQQPGERTWFDDVAIWPCVNKTEQSEKEKTK